MTVKNENVNSELEIKEDTIGNVDPVVDKVDSVIQNSDDVEEKLFTQDQVDDIVRRRLDRQRESISKINDEKSTLELKVSEFEKLNNEKSERINELEDKLNSAKNELENLHLANAFGIDNIELISKLGIGLTFDEKKDILAGMKSEFSDRSTRRLSSLTSNNEDDEEFDLMLTQLNNRMKIH